MRGTNVRTISMALIGGLISATTVLSAGSGGTAARSGSGAQPHLVPLRVSRCIECRSTAKNRLAVMSPEIGSLSGELHIPADSVAAKVRDAIETELAGSPALVLVNRSQLQSVLGEQALAQSGAANSELAPQAGRIIPAQLQLHVTVDRVDVTTSTNSQSSDTSERFYRQAAYLEAEADELMGRAERAGADAEEIRSREPQPGARNSGANYISMFTACYGDEKRACQQSSSQEAFAACMQGAQAWAKDCAQERNRRYEERALEQSRRSAAAAQGRESARADGEARRLINEGARLRRQAATLRNQAQLDSRKHVAEARTSKVTAALNWRVVDTSTGAIVGAGTVVDSDQSQDTGVAVQGAFEGTSTTQSSRFDVVVNRVLGRLVPRLRSDLERKLEAVPLHVKIVKVDAGGVVINVGSVSGLVVGDTFGVRQKAEILTDPDTGLPLTTPGPPIGVIRVFEVAERTSFAQVIREAGPLARGDELEWIGMFVEQRP